MGLLSLRIGRAHNNENKRNLPGPMTTFTYLDIDDIEVGLEKLVLVNHNNGCVNLELSRSLNT